MVLYRPFTYEKHCTALDCYACLIWNNDQQDLQIFETASEDTVNITPIIHYTILLYEDLAEHNTDLHACDDNKQQYNRYHEHDRQTEQCKDTVDIQA